MNLLQLTLDTPAENLALDEALLDAAEEGEIRGGVLRLWAPEQYCVVLGRSSEAEVEVDLAACREAGVPVLRRSSGGGTVVAGPGCLMYAVVLNLEAHPQLRAIDQAHRYVLQRMADILTPLLNNVSAAGISDLVFQPQAESEAQELPRKFSGNALRIKRHHLLYHGTLLYDFDLEQIDRLLGSATRQPDYRAERGHREFVDNLPLERDKLISALIDGWLAKTTLHVWPARRVAGLICDRYSGNPMWTIFDPA